MAKSIVIELIEAMNKNDSNTIRSLFATNAKQAYGSSKAKKGEQFRSWLETDIIQAQGKVSNPQYKESDNQVVVTGTYSNNNGYTNAADFLFEVEKGKITSWTMRY